MQEMRELSLKIRLEFKHRRSLGRVYRISCISGSAFFLVSHYIYRFSQGRGHHAIANFAVVQRATRLLVLYSLVIRRSFLLKLKLKYIVEVIKRLNNASNGIEVQDLSLVCQMPKAFLSFNNSTTYHDKSYHHILMHLNISLYTTIFCSILYR